MPMTRFEISRLTSGDYALRMFPADGSGHELLSVVGRTLGRFASEAEALSRLPDFIPAEAAHEVVVRPV